MLPGRRIDWLAETDSTMFVAARLAREGCAPGTVVGADAQTAGIGRHGRSWHSEQNTGLYVSIVLRPSPAIIPSILMLAIGLAAREAVEKTCGLSADLRWPNDLLLNEKKCAGILALQEGQNVILGVGINCTQQAFPGELQDSATSLYLAGAATVSREQLLVALLESIDQHLALEPAKIRELFAQYSSYASGRQVQVEQDGRVLYGETCGLTDAGFLQLWDPSSGLTTILAGGVRPAKPAR